jgi:competence protein ComEC
MTKDRSLGHRAPLLWLVLPLMGGLIAGRGGAVTSVASALSVALVAAVAAVVAANRAPRMAMAALGAAMFFAGDASYLLHRRRPPESDGRSPHEAWFSLRIDHVYPQSAPRKAGGLGVVVHAGGRTPPLIGQRIYYAIALRNGQAAPERSEVVAVAGLLTALPRNPPANTFYGSLAAQGLNFTLIRARILGEERPATAYYRLCDRIALRMNALLGAGLERRPELAAMYRAMMLGRKSDLRPEQKRLFMHSGAMHLFAINGLHIGMVAAALHALFALARCPRLPASLAVLAVLWLDVDTTGASPSAVRAFLMVASLEAAYAVRRPGNPIAALTLSALLVLLLNPMDFFSASFQMSYAVVTAILTLGLPLSRRLERRFPAYRDLPEITWSRFQRVLAAVKRHLLQASGIGVAAALVSAVTGIEFFGLFAPGGIVANLVLVPLASLVIVSGCLSLIVPHFGTQAALVFNEAAAVVLYAIDALMRVGSRVPGAWIPAHYRAEWIGPAALAALLAALIAGYAFGWRRERGGWWPPFAIVAATLAFGVKFGG